MGLCIRYTYRSCWTMKTHIMKLLANTFCAYAKARIGLEQITRQQGIGDFVHYL